MIYARIHQFVFITSILISSLLHSNNDEITCYDALMTLRQKTKTGYIENYQVTTPQGTTEFVNLFFKDNEHETVRITAISSPTLFAHLCEGLQERNIKNVIIRQEFFKKVYLSGRIELNNKDVLNPEDQGVLISLNSIAS